MKKYIEAGKIVGTHGIKGELRVQPWADSGEFLAGFRTLYFGAGEKRLDVRSARPHKNIVIMKIAGVDSIEAADALRGRVLYIDRADAHLPEGRYFIQDIIGCRVTDADSGTVYGTICDVSSTGVNDVYHVKTPDGAEYLIPAIDQVLASTDIEAGEVRIHAMKGMFDDED